MAGIFSCKSSIPKHHDQSPSVQKRFLADTKALILAHEEVGNPFDKEIVMLETKEVLSDEMAHSIMRAQEVRKKQHSAFAKERLESQVVSFHDPIKVNKIPLPSNRHKKHKNKVC